MSEYTDQDGENGYDFKKFISHLKDPMAEPIIKYTKSFIQNFMSSERLYTMKEQIRLISDFELFIFEKFSKYEPFKSMNQEQIKNSKDCMEKLITSKIYIKIFSPLVAANNGLLVLDEDHLLNVEQDKKLCEKIKEFRFVTPDMLELSSGTSKTSNTDEDGINTKSFVLLNKFSIMAAKELSKLNRFKAPRDKMICILNSCKILFAFLKRRDKNSNADDFIPLLIYTLLHSGDPALKFELNNLASNCSYIENFRRSDFLTGENRYYLSSFQGVIQFILEMNEGNLKITKKEEYEKEYEANKQKVLQEGKEIEMGKKEQQQQQQQQQQNQATSANDLSLFSGLFASTAENTNNSGAASNGDIFGLFSSFLGSGPASSTDSTSSAKAPTAEGGVESSADASASQSQKHKSKRKVQPAAQEEDYMETIRSMEEKEQQNTLDNMQEMFPEIDVDLVKDICVFKKYHTGECIDTLLELSSG
ncbi:hypothetical protein ACO0QE_003841 [Hanseniaspora vineae]